MSSGTNNTTRIAFLPPEFDLPWDQPELLAEVMNERERQTGTIVNQKTNGVYSFEEVVNSETWVFTPNTPSNGFRRMYDVPTLAAGSSVSIPHNLGNLATFTFTDIFGVVHNADNTSFRPLDPETIEVTSTNIIITLPGGSVYDGYSGQIVLEYVKS